MFFYQDLFNNRKENICRQFSVWNETVLCSREILEMASLSDASNFKIGIFETNLNFFCSQLQLLILRGEITPGKKLH